MVAWFIIAIATLAVFALIAINGVQTVSATTDGVGRVETVRRLETAAAAISARTGSPNNTGHMLVIAGTTVNSVYGLPTELSAYASTPFGQRIVYCPFGDGESGTSSASVPAGGGSTYTIQTKADSTGRIFVTDGRPSLPEVANNPNLMAYLIAPRTKTSPTPTCSSVRYNPTTNRFEAPDAIVRPVLRASAPEDQRQQAGREIVYYVSTSGTGTGLSPNDPAALYTAITYYRSALPQAMRIIMSAGNYVLPTQYMNATVGGFSDKGNAGTLVIDGASVGSIDFAGTSDIWVPGNLELRNLTVTTNAGIWAEQGHKLTLVNTITGYIKINNGGSLQANNITATDTRNGFAIYVNDGSNADLNGTVNAFAANGNNGVVSAGGSRVVFENAILNVSIPGGSVGNAALYNEENSDLVFKSSQVNINSGFTYPSLVYGRETWYNSNLALNFASPARIFEVQRGGFLSLLAGTFGQGNIPQFGIIDDGAGGFAGSVTVRASTNCFAQGSGTQFAMTAASGNNTSSAVTADEGVPAMSANPTSAEVQANAAVNARNTVRAQLRNTNTSTYTCSTS